MNPTKACGVLTFLLFIGYCHFGFSQEVTTYDQLQGVWHDRSVVFIFKGYKCEYIQLAGELTDYSLTKNVIKIKEKPIYLRYNEIRKIEGKSEYTFVIRKITKDSLVLTAMNNDAISLLADYDKHLLEDYKDKTLRLHRYVAPSSTNVPDELSITTKPDPFNINGISIVYNEFNLYDRDSSFTMYVEIPSGKFYLAKKFFSREKGSHQIDNFEGQLTTEEMDHVNSLINHLDWRDFSVQSYFYDQGSKNKFIVNFKNDEKYMTSVSTSFNRYKIGMQLFFHYLSTEKFKLNMYKTATGFNHILEGGFMMR